MRRLLAGLLAGAIVAATATDVVAVSAAASTVPPGGCPAPANSPGGADGMGGCFPGPANTGVPEGTVLTPYTGPCTITVADTVIDSKTISDCEVLAIRANNVTIRRSHLVFGDGDVVGVDGVEADGAAFRIEDSWIDNGVCTNCSVDGWNFTILRTEITGSNRGAYCQHVCRIEDSWIHATALDPHGAAHASAVRLEQYATLIHNTLACDWDDPIGEVGCSANLSGYPDFVPIHHNTIDGNLLVANPIGAGFCAYGGWNPGKPFNDDPTNATYVVFRNNVFQRGSSGKCGTYGPITSFNVSRTGNVWQNNRWSTGELVPPAE